MPFWNDLTEITPSLYLCNGRALCNRKGVEGKDIKLIVNVTTNLPDPKWNTDIKTVIIIRLLIHSFFMY